MDSKKKKKYLSIASDLSIKNKMLFINLTAVISVAVVIFAVFKTVNTVQKEKQTDMQKTIITASEHLMEMTVESGVAIAKTIYTNESIYAFLNRDYPSSAEYYDAFYEFQKNSSLAIADTNIVKKYTVYSENSSVLQGGFISSFDSVKNQEWYHAYKKMDKPMILYISDNNVSLIRKLDFQTLSTGESCLKLDLNMNLLTNYCDNLDFNGELYIISGGSLIYSSNKDMTIDKTDINQDFECYTKNYYTADIEYYSHETKKPMIQFIKDSSMFIFIFTALLIVMIVLGQIFAVNIKKRIRSSAEALCKGEKLNIYKGKDEVGELIDICSAVSEKLTLSSNERERTNEEFLQKNSSYNSLFTTAMRLDAELYTMKNYPEMHTVDSENIPFEEEFENIRIVAEKNGVEISSEITDSHGIEVPAYSLMLIADDLISPDTKTSVKAFDNENGVSISFHTDKIQESSKVLKINAVFEDGGITDEYSFRHNYTYNPYIRLKHCLGSNTEAEITNRNGFTLVINIISEKSDNV